LVDILILELAELPPALSIVEVVGTYTISLVEDHVECTVTAAASNP
jgi:hypothetical protein